MRIKSTNRLKWKFNEKQHRCMQGAVYRGPYRRDFHETGTVPESRDDGRPINQSATGDSKHNCAGICGERRPDNSRKTDSQKSERVIY